jgi:hypothetical protein
MSYKLQPGEDPKVAVDRIRNGEVLTTLRLETSNPIVVVLTADGEMVTLPRSVWSEMQATEGPG